MASSDGEGRALATLVGAAGVVVWASETVLIKLAGALPPLEMVALAFAAGTVVSAIAGALTGRLTAAIFRQPMRAWLLFVPSLVGYHGCIYFAVQRAPAAPAALLQGFTPLLIVVGSAFLPNEHPRWWHWAGACLGLAGAVTLIGWGSLGGIDGGGECVRPGAGRRCRGAVGPLQPRRAGAGRCPDRGDGGVLRGRRADLRGAPLRP